MKNQSEKKKRIIKIHELVILIVVLVTGIFIGKFVEAGPSRVSAIHCNDKIDNDGDGRIDYPNDPGCSNSKDKNEKGTLQCDDSLDNDADAKIDYPSDPGCASPSDSSEIDITQCNDAIDNGDADNLIDLFDPGCSSTSDNIEADGQCDDTIDNDGDTKIDYLNDVGCLGYSDSSEYSSVQCDDGIDNDLDNKIDYPYDSGCSGLSDNDEVDPALPSFNGACEVSDAYTSIPMGSAADIGGQYVKRHIDGVNDIVGLKAACSDNLFRELLSTFCTSSSTVYPISGKHEPVSAGVVTYSSDGNVQQSSCAASGCSEWGCGILNYTGTINGACILRGPGSTPMVYDSDIGTSYTKRHIAGVNDINGLKSSCTDTVGKELLASYCSSSQTDPSTGKKYPAQFGVVTYGVGGGSSSSSCAASGCSDWTCDMLLNTEPISGACLMMDSYTGVPNFGNADIGTAYIKRHMQGINNITQLRSVCTDQIGMQMLGSYCLASETVSPFTGNREPVSYSVVTYSESGGYQSFGSAASGAAKWTCDIINYNQTISGACLVRDASTSMPFVTYPDVGSRYVKQHVLGVNDFSTLRSSCTDNIYTSLMDTYCSSSLTINPATGVRGPVIYEISTFGAGGGSSSSGCAASGCTYHYCP